MLGADQPVILHMLDIPPAAESLNGVKMELTDAAFPLLKGMTEMKLVTYDCLPAMVLESVILSSTFKFSAYVDLQLIMLICTSEVAELCFLSAFL